MPDSSRAALRALHRADEAQTVRTLVARADVDAATRARAAAWARELALAVRGAAARAGGLDAFLHEFDLSSREGVALLCVAEALLRIPDADTVNALIRDKIGRADWEGHLAHADNLFVHAGTWALMLTGQLVELDRAERDLPGLLRRLVARAGEPLVRRAVLAAVRILGRQFVMGRTIEEALERARPAEQTGARHSYDMLGEAARTAADAQRYYEAYSHAIDAVGAEARARPPHEAPGISVKLSALHPRYEFAQRARVLQELVPLLTTLARHAARAGIGLTVDAEECDRLELSLDVLEAVVLDAETSGWGGLGVAVQAYQKRAPALIDALAALARRGRRRLVVRLVKGAYWDTEIKLAQERGLDGFPVFTRKVYTDVSYLACARQLLADAVVFRPAFATHNAHTIATVLALAPGRDDYEFQRLHGMGEALYDEVRARHGRPCRVYAPVGSHEDLLAYLVRRLLENGANTSFVNRIVDRSLPVETLLQDPVERARALDGLPHPRIRLPRDLYAPERRNSRGLDLADALTVERIESAVAASREETFHATPLVDGASLPGAPKDVRSPADLDDRVGSVVEADAAAIDRALAGAAAAFAAWDATPAVRRAACLERAGDLIEAHTEPLIALLVREGGRTIPDALGEVREAVDFCRYYAQEACRLFAAPAPLPGPVGERNGLRLAGRGVFVCISPWNFPLAIFCGQVIAALAAGNTVVAKPAEQTPLIAAEAVRLLHRAGVPAQALQLVPGDGCAGAALVADSRTAGVAFTGSTETARAIAQALAARDGPLVPFVAETGGQNALIVDSSALPEQVVRDAVVSAFNSAGQRCSALRVLYLQEEIAPRVIDMLAGAMRELAVGNPARLSTDVGPVIDAEARAALETHVERLSRFARCIESLRPGEEWAKGHLFPPQAWEIDRLDRLAGEVFGPILHVIRWRAADLDRVLDDIAATRYGLTLGIHSRIDATVERIVAHARVGNIYVNRNMIGAVVGVQPFGGEGLSGTGPKAGGPHYLLRFAVERTLSVDTTAAGGNASLLSLGED